MTASNSTNNSDFSEQRFDSRPPIFGRTITSVFPPYFAFKHQGTGPIKTALILVMLVWEFLVNLPQLFLLRRFFRKYRKTHKKGDIRVAYCADCLDEVNGIANNLRQVGSFMRTRNYDVSLIGCVFQTRTRGVIEDSYVFLLPRFFSMEAIGYPNTELAIPHLGTLVKLLKRYPVDLIEFETPSSVGWAVLVCAKIIGIKTIGHYRTDAMSYVRMLVSAKWVHVAVLFFTRIFYYLARPVVSPGEAYKKILIDEIRVPEKDVFILPRGIALDLYHPSKRNQGKWEKIVSSPAKKVRFLFVGRISKEKDIPFLEDLWHEFHKQNVPAELLFAGDGWYLETLRKNFADCPEVHCVGVQQGEDLAGLYADADFFIFPSGTDTFGNVVVEALASGTPAIVADRGGPQDIIRNKNCGYILPFHDMDTWLQQLDSCVRLVRENPEAYQAMRENAFTRSLDFTLERSASAQWEFFQKICAEHYHEKES